MQKVGQRRPPAVQERCVVWRSVRVSLSVLLLWSAPGVLAQNKPLGTAQHTLGSFVVVRPDHIEEELQGQRSLQLFEGDVLRTNDASQALITIYEGIVVALNEHTILKLFNRWEKAKGITPILRLQQGELWVKAGPGSQPLEVETPVATAAGRETEFNMQVQEDGQTTLTVIQGTVDFGTALNTWSVPASTVSYAGRGKRCTKPELMDVKPAIAWLRTIVN
jgi:hypothetical protein